MSRLIDADKLVEAIKEYFKGEVDKIPKTMQCGVVFDSCNTILEHNQGVLKVIESQPVAFNKENVIEQLYEATEEHEDETGFDDFSYIEPNTAIEIVEGGGNCE